ncbi:MAG TPA: hypothetical protein VF079_02205 [Sphingomicrobium sp.]
MSWFPSPSTPRAAIRDLLAVMRHSSREQRIGAALAVLVTGIIVFEFVVDTRMGLDPTPTPTYVQLYSADRTDADIIADQKKEQAAKQAAEKEKQRQFQRLEKRLGID